MDSACYLRNCTQIKSQPPSIKNKCQVPDTVEEDIDGCKYHKYYQRLSSHWTMLTFPS